MIRTPVVTYGSPPPATLIIVNYVERPGDTFSFQARPGDKRARLMLTQVKADRPAVRR
jgi:hypothetical protein